MLVVCTMSKSNSTIKLRSAISVGSAACVYLKIKSYLTKHLPHKLVLLKGFSFNSYFLIVKIISSLNFWIWAAYCVCVHQGLCQSV